MKQIIRDVDGREFTITTREADLAPIRAGDSPGDRAFAAALEIGGELFLADLDTLDAMLSALQEARDEIAEEIQQRDTITGLPPALHADA